MVLVSACDSCSWWHSAQSNHFRPKSILGGGLDIGGLGAREGSVQQGDRMETWALRMCLLVVLVGNLGSQTLGWRTYHMMDQTIRCPVYTQRCVWRLAE